MGLSEKEIEVIEGVDYAEDTLPIICKHCGRVTRIRVLNNKLISEFVEDLKNKHYFNKVYRSNLIEKWEEKQK